MQMCLRLGSLAKGSSACAQVCACVRWVSLVMCPNMSGEESCAVNEKRIVNMTGTASLFSQKYIICAHYFSAFFS